MIGAVRCWLGLHTWASWKFADEQSVDQIRSCYRCHLVGSRNLVALHLATLTERQGWEGSFHSETLEVPFDPVMLSISPSEQSYADDYGGGSSTTTHLFTIDADGGLSQQTAALSALPNWASYKWLLVRRRDVTRSYWQQQRDGSLEGYNIATREHVEYARIPG